VEFIKLHLGMRFWKTIAVCGDLDLSGIDKNTQIQEVVVVPWQVGDLDGAPCTVLAKIGLR
jgi:kynurenine formamidase